MWYLFFFAKHGFFFKLHTKEKEILSASKTIGKMKNRQQELVIFMRKEICMTSDIQTTKQTLKAGFEALSLKGGQTDTEMMVKRPVWITIASWIE